MDKNLKGELAIMDGMGIKPNYAALGRKYGMDWSGIERIGTYSNFNKYVTKQKLKPKKKEGGNPRYEKNPGEQA